MNSKSFSKPIFLWLFIALPIISLFVMKSSFNLGLYGDDWQHLYNLWRDFFVYHRKSFFDIGSYLNPYWPSYLYLGIINHFWGFYAPAYFIASFLMRIFANIALYFLAFTLTKNKLAAVLASLIFLFSAAGLQTTDWVFNMNTYLGIGFLSLTTIVYLKIRDLKTFKSKLYFLYIPILTLALAIVPTRMHGAVPFLIISDVYLSFVSLGYKLKINRFFIFRVLLTILIFVSLLHFKSFGEGSFTTDRLSESSQIIHSLNEKGFYAFWLYFFGILGHLVLPNNINLEGFSAVIGITGFLSIILGLIVSFAISRNKIFKVNLPVILFNLTWALVLIWVASINPNPLPNLNPYTPSHVLFSIDLGGQLIFWGIWLSILTRKIRPHLSASLIVSLIWIISLSIIYWLFTPYYILETTARYMSLGSAGFAIFFSCLIALLFSLVDFKSKSENIRVFNSFFAIVPITFLLFWIIFNFQASQAYLGTLELTRNRELTDRTWDTLIKNVPTLDPAGPSVFYFTTDNPLSLHGVLVFGFFMRAGMTYRIPDQDLTPLPSTDYNELLSYVADGSPLQKIHGRKAVPVPLSRIFAFDFRNGTLTNISDIVRKKITEDLKINK